LPRQAGILAGERGEEYGISHNRPEALMTSFAISAIFLLVLIASLRIA
jgi:hypothetical protein